MKSKFNLQWLSAILMLFMASFAAFAQNGALKVKVSDKMGALAGAGVVVRGTSNGAITDVDGVASLTGVPSDGTIEVSMIDIIY